MTFDGTAAMNFMSGNERLSKTIAVKGFNEAALDSARWRISYRLLEPVAMAFDAFGILFAYVLSEYLYLFLTKGSLSDGYYFSVAVATAILFIGVAKIRQLYKPTKLLALGTQLRTTILIWMSVLLFCVAVIFAWKIEDQFSRSVSIVFSAFGLAALSALRLFWCRFIDFGLSESWFANRAVIFITEPISSAEQDLQFQLMKQGCRIDRLFVLPGDKVDSRRYTKIISRVIKHARGSDIDEIIISADLTRWSELTPIFTMLRVLPLPVKLVPLGASALLTLPLKKIGDSVCIEIQREPLTAIEQAMKRGFDIVCAATCLILLFPLLVMTAVAVKFDSSGPIVFLQRRCGFNGKQFKIFKFRTMNVLEDGPSVVPALPDDDRVTGIGKWLRKTSIDELPQLLNVLVGNMSIVGPRPHAVAHDDQLQKIVQNYAFRHHVKPGITGWAQVHGFRGQFTTHAAMKKRLELDVWYINNWSLGLDFWIVFRTAFEVLRGDNAY